MKNLAVEFARRFDVCRFGPFGPFGRGVFHMVVDEAGLRKLHIRCVKQIHSKSILSSRNWVHYYIKFRR